MNRDSGTASANGGWLRRLVRPHGQHNKISPSNHLTTLRFSWRRLCSNAFSFFTAHCRIFLAFLRKYFGSSLSLGIMLLASSLAAEANNTSDLICFIVRVMWPNARTHTRRADDVNRESGLRAPSGVVCSDFVRRFSHHQYPGGAWWKGVAPVALIYKNCQFVVTASRLLAP